MPKGNLSAPLMNHLCTKIMKGGVAHVQVYKESAKYKVEQ